MIRGKISHYVLPNGNKDGIERSICYKTINGDQCKWVTKYVNGKKEGRTWVWSYFYQQIMERGRYVDDKKEGV